MCYSFCPGCARLCGGNNEFRSERKAGTIQYHSQLECELKGFTSIRKRKGLLLLYNIIFPI
uniref:Uncharacterized protein n=1 Tax=Picea glauca TaxID=3330 RepID=A0A101M106_PICGL|nr:hypothetical protein ABT39_MTgene4264 [Picea glauca]